MLRLYCPDLKPGQIELPPQEAHHAAASLRAKVGMPLTLFDGQGHEAEGFILSISKRAVLAHAGAIRTRAFDCAYRLTMAIALGKAHRQGYAVEKCTELGVAQIWPMITERSVTKPREAAVEKWSRRAIEAAKQCARAFVPAIASPQSFRDVLSRINEFDARAIGAVPSEPTHHELRVTPAPLNSPPPRLGEAEIGRDGGGPSGGEDQETGQLVKQSTFDDRQSTIPARSISFLDLLRSFPARSRVLCLIGPEGDWSDAEIAAAQAAGLSFVHLAPTILRTETAAVTACAAAALVSLEY